MAPLLFFSFIFSIFSISALPHSLNNHSHQQQQHLLLRFKATISSNNTSLPDWTPFLPICNWTGLTCDPSSHSVLALNLSSMSLDGTISPLLGNLSSLQSVDLSNNALTGTIPPQLGQLHRLQNLSLQIMHCDLKPSNVLLDANMTALVTDFGISRLTTTTNSIDSLSTTTFSLKGSIGYIAPEYGLGGSVSIKGDVYSYGILILEMVTRKRPSDDMFARDMNLQKWVRSAFPNRLADIVDSGLLGDVNENMEDNRCLLSFIHVGLLCTNESPRERPSMRDVAKVLESLKTSFMGVAATSKLTSTISDLLHNTNPTETLASDSQSSTF